MSGKHDFENPGERISAQINGNGGGKWFGITQQGGYAPSFVNDNSPEEKHMLIEGTTESVSFYPFHCQHLTLAFRSQCDIVETSNVNFYSIKQEGASAPILLANVI